MNLKKYQNVHKVGGKMPIKKVVIKIQQQKKSSMLVAIAKKKKQLTTKDCETTNSVSICYFASFPLYLRFVLDNFRVVFHLYALYSLDNQCFQN
jgi:hypothetical protein